MADKVSLFYAVRPHKLDDPAFQLLARDGGAVTVLDVEAESEQIANKGVGEPHHLLGCAPLEEPYMLVGRAHIEPVGELVQQARLTHPGLADNCDNMGLALVDGRLQRQLHSPQLGLPPDRAGLNSLDAAGGDAKRAR